MEKNNNLLSKIFQLMLSSVTYFHNFYNKIEFDYILSYNNNNY